MDHDVTRTFLLVLDKGYIHHLRPGLKTKCQGIEMDDSCPPYIQVLGGFSRLYNTELSVEEFLNNEQNHTPGEHPYLPHLRYMVPNLHGTMVWRNDIDGGADLYTDNTLQKWIGCCFSTYGG
jgi:hypothetical protein